jgi:hypothetical protein
MLSIRSQDVLSIYDTGLGTVGNPPPLSRMTRLLRARKPAPTLMLKLSAPKYARQPKKKTNNNQQNKTKKHT